LAGTDTTYAAQPQEEGAIHIIAAIITFVFLKVLNLVRKVRIQTGINTEYEVLDFDYL
jgi:hypothetical protein